MKTDVWMPFYLGDYLRDTMHLTTEQHGAYLLLLLSYWARGEALPDDDTYLASVTKLMANAWQSHRQTLGKFFTIADGKWIHSRVEEELEKAKALKIRRSEAGKAGADGKWHGKRNGKRMRLPLAKTCDSHVPSPSPSPSTNNDRLEGFLIPPQTPPKPDPAQQAEEIYQAYPRKTAHKAALQAITRQFGKHAPDYLLTQTRLYAQTMAGADLQFVPHPATWFNQERFTETPEQWRPPSNGTSSSNHQTPNNRVVGTLNESHVNDYAQGATIRLGFSDAQ